MTRREMLRSVALAVLLALSGCSQARYAMTDQYGGVIAMPNNTNNWPMYHRKHAEELMAQKCPQGYVIEQEGEFVTGQNRTTHTEGNENSAAYQLLGVGHVDSTTSVHDVTEWRIHFRAKDTPASVPPLRFGPAGAAPNTPPAVVPLTATAPNLGLPPAPVPVGP